MERIEPKPGQESVWDYPRPPRLEPTSKQIRIECAGEVIASTNGAYRVLETSHPPVYYLPPADTRMELLTRASGSSFCEWKGHAGYYDLVIGERTIRKAAWFYAKPAAAFSPIAEYVAFYPSKMDACYVDGELAVAQPGDFYGGWITSDIVGPFKGGAGTWGW